MDIQVLIQVQFVSFGISFFFVLKHNVENLTNFDKLEEKTDKNP